MVLISCNGTVVIIKTFLASSKARQYDNLRVTLDFELTEPSLKLFGLPSNELPVYAESLIVPVSVLMKFPDGKANLPFA